MINTGNEKIASRIKSLRLDRGLTQVQLAEKLRVSQNIISSWEVGRTKPSQMLSKVADFFGVSIDYLVGESEVRNAEKKIASPRVGVKIPLVGSIVAGEPSLALEDVEDFVEISPSLAASGDFFALRVHGDSMSPHIADGDIAIIKITSEFRNGQVCLVYVGLDETTLKQVQKTEEGITLIGFNTSVYTPHFYSRRECIDLPVKIGGVLKETRKEWK